MRHTPLAIAALAGALIAWLAVSCWSEPVGVPDSTGPLVAQVEVAVSATRAAEAERDSVLAVLADSTEAWATERRRLARATAQARREADSIATDLRATLDTAGVRMLDELVEAHTVEVRSLTETILTHETEVTALRAGLRSADLLIRAQADEIHARTVLDAERRSMEDALRAELRKKTRTHRLTMIVAVGALAAAALN